jgi:hypothetical protein
MVDLGHGQVWKHPGSGANYIQIATTGALTMAGSAKVYRTRPYGFNFSTVTGTGKPTLVSRGVFYGFSLPIYSADNEELFACACIPLDWDAESSVVLYIGGWIDTANDTKNFKLQTSFERWTAGTTVPTSSVDVPVETPTGATAAQYKSFKIAFTYPAVAQGLVVGDALGFRLRRIAASANEIAGEFVVEGAVLMYQVNKLGGAV